MRNRLAIRYAVEGDIRFISHHDTMRLFRRAFARGGIPVRYSEGFNPHPRMTIVLPRPVGVASDDELLVIHLTSELAPSDAISALSPQLPAGITLRSAEVLAEGERRVPVRASYCVEFDSASAAHVAERVSTFLQQDSVTVQRTASRPNAVKTIDLRSFVQDMASDDHSLSWTQSVTQAGTARVGEILEAVGLEPADHIHRLRRCTVTYDS